MNNKVIAAFVSFAVLLGVWIGLAESARPELSDLLVFVKGATITAWTAAALFFETADKPVNSAIQTQQDAQKAPDNPTNTQP